MEGKPQGEEVEEILNPILFAGGLLILPLVLFPRSRLFFLPSLYFLFEFTEKEITFLPLMSASVVLILRFLFGKKRFFYLETLLALLPAFFLSFFAPSSSRLPLLPFPSSGRLSAPLPVFLSLLIFLFRSRGLFRFVAFLPAGSFFFPSLSPLFHASLFLITAWSTYLIEEEIVRGEGEFFSSLMKRMWQGTKVLFFLFLFAIVFVAEERFHRDLLYLLLSLLLIDAGFLLKSATILVRHKVYFASLGLVLSSLLFLAFI